MKLLSLPKHETLYLTRHEKELATKWEINFSVKHKYTGQHFVNFSFIGTNDELRFACQRIADFIYGLNGNKEVDRIDANL